MLPDPAVHPGNLSLEESGPSSLEQRVQRLEQAVGELRDTQRLEERVAERVRDRLQNPAAPASAPGSAAERVAAGQPPPPQLKDGPSPREGVFVSATSNPEPVKSRWFLVDLWTETRAMLRMFFDYRYRVAISTWIIVILMLPVILFSHWWFPLAYIPVIGTYFDKLLDLCLAFFAYKALSREARRYMKFRGG